MFGEGDCCRDQDEEEENDDLKQGMIRSDNGQATVRR